MVAGTIAPLAKSGRRKLQAGQATSRDQLLDAASLLMIERQSVDISLSELAERSGLNSALVKYYFGSKKGLMLALLRRSASAALAQLGHLSEMKTSATVKMKLHIAGVINTYNRYPFWNRLVHFLLEDPDSQEWREIVDYFVRPLTEFQRDLLEEGRRSGEFVEVDPMMFYLAVIGACDHPFVAKYAFRVFGLNDFDDPGRKAYIEFVTTMVLRTILVDPSRAGADSRLSGSAG